MGDPIIIMITGANGQLGLALQQTAPEEYSLYPYDIDLDICDDQKINDVISRIRPVWIINASAYTAVDQAEEEPEKAYAVNRDGVRNLALSAKEFGARLVHVSTDYVFDGEKSCPYLPADKPNPLGIYGASKYEGEQEALRILGDKALVIRTAWLYSLDGHNFFKTILRLICERESLQVVTDQIGTPTWAKSLAQAIWKAIEKELHGIHHWTDSGVASWYDFAVAIQEEAKSLGIIQKTIPIYPISTDAFPTKARRPANSLLDKNFTWKALGYHAPHWQENLRQMLIELKRQNECEDSLLQAVRVSSARTLSITG